MAKDAIGGYVESLKKHKEPVPVFQTLNLVLGARDSVLKK